MAQIIPEQKDKLYSVSMDSDNPRFNEVKTINWKQGLILIVSLGIGIWLLNKQASKFDESDIRA